MSFGNRENNSLEAGSLSLGEILQYASNGLILFWRMIEENDKVSSNLRWMALLGLPDNELPEPAKLTTRTRRGHAEKTEFMAEGTGTGRPFLQRNRIYDQHAVVRVRLLIL